MHFGHGHSSGTATDYHKIKVERSHIKICIKGNKEII